MCRETRNIWWYLFSFQNNPAGTGKGRWRGFDLFAKRFWCNWGNVRHDSLGKYIYRFMGCSHTPVFLSDNCDGRTDVLYCFKCEREITHREAIDKAHK